MRFASPQLMRTTFSDHFRDQREGRGASHHSIARMGLRFTGQSPEGTRGSGEVEARTLLVYAGPHPQSTPGHVRSLGKGEGGENTGLGKVPGQTQMTNRSRSPVVPRADFFFFFFLVFLPFLGPLPKNVEVPRLGVESEL